MMSAPDILTKWDVYCPLGSGRRRGCGGKIVVRGSLCWSVFGACWILVVTALWCGTFQRRFNGLVAPKKFDALWRTKDHSIFGLTFAPPPCTSVYMIFLLSMGTVLGNKECLKTSDQKTHRKDPSKKTKTGKAKQKIRKEARKSPRMKRHEKLKQKHQKRRP